MLFDNDSNSDFIEFDDQSIVAANNTKTVKMRVGSIHRPAVVSKSSMKYLSEKKLQRQAQQRKKDVETNEPQKDSEHFHFQEHTPNSLKNNEEHLKEIKFIVC